MPAKTQALPLTCPDCDGEVKLPEAQCVEGALRDCPHCRQQLVLTREWTEDGDKFRWVLVDTEEELGDDERRP